MALGRKTGGGSRRGRPNRATAEIRSIAAAYGTEAVARLATLMRSSPDERIAMLAATELLDRGFGRSALALPSGPDPISPAFADDFVCTSDEDAARVYQEMIHGHISAANALDVYSRSTRQKPAATSPLLAAPNASVPEQTAVPVRAQAGP
jgi:hypothetical protein